ncbi:MAG TPA: EAL domain-containing protein [Thermoanaerobaculia bacterium]
MRRTLPVRIPFLETPATGALQNELLEAMESGQLMLHYQPQVRIADGRIAAVEALLRWNHPTFGPITPMLFLPRIERLPFMHVLTQWVILSALEQATYWRASGTELRVAVNIAPATAEDPLFPEWLHDIVSKSGVNPSTLELEITERCAIQHWQRATRVLHRVARSGVRIAIDDFGAGYSPLSHLRDFPVSQLKIDRSLVTSLAECSRTESIFCSILDLARRLSIEVVPEGVENEDVLNVLRRAGCIVAQGYYLGEPMERRRIETAFAGRLGYGSFSAEKPTPRPQKRKARRRLPEAKSAVRR